MVDVNFSMSRYDSDGDCIEGGVFLHFGDTCVRVADDLEDLEKFQARITKIVTEIAENY